MNLKENFPSAFRAMPQELISYTIQNCVSASPYNRYNSGSFYSTSTKTWNHTEDGTIRVSDHWNFYSQGETHCITDVPNSMIAGKWVVAQYNAATNTYTVICADEKNYTAEEKHLERKNNKVVTISEPARRRIERLEEIRYERRRIARAKKMKQQNLWITCETNIWKKGSRGHWNHCGIEFHLGTLVWESKTGKSFIIQYPSGGRREIRSCANYKELPRKPYTKKAPK